MSGQHCFMYIHDDSKFTYKSAIEMCLWTNMSIATVQRGDNRQGFLGKVVSDRS